MANLLTLPDEIKIKIFEYLNGVDKIHILKTCQDLYRVGVDKNILKSLNFSKNYKLTLAQLKYIARKHTGFKVTTLNLNGVHWITSAHLRNTLVKFPNLNALYVLDTQLTFTDLAKTLETTKKVRKLAFSLKSYAYSDVSRIPICTPITHLYVIYNFNGIHTFMNFLAKFSKLEELWLMEPRWPIKIKLTQGTPWCLFIKNSLPEVTRRIVLSRQGAPYSDGEDLLDRIKCLNGNWKTDSILVEEHTLFVIVENEGILTPLDKNLYKIQTKLPKMVDSEANKEFNFCATEQKTLSSTISGHSRHIRKLKCDSKLFWNCPQAPQAPEETILFKKRRIGLPSQKVDENSKFAKFVQHATEMEEFELIHLNGVGVRDQLWTMDNLSLARNWKILKKLTITSVNMHNGKFLIDITKHCLMLKCLKIQDDLVQDNISSSLCEALQYALNLKDFRYERKGGIPVDLLFESLTKCYQLERLYIQCGFACKISKKPIETVITRCENLIFLFLFISELHDTVCKTIKQSIKEFIKPGQIILIRGQSYHLGNIMLEDIPYCHVEEIVCQESDPNCGSLLTFLNDKCFT